MSKLIPKLSAEIEFNPLARKEFILSNTQHQHYLKINQETYDLLSLIDGNRDLEQIVDIYNNKYHKNILTDDVERLLYEKLSIYGILEGFDDKIKKYQKPAYLKLSFIIIPQKLLSKVVPYFYFLFRRKIAIPILLLSIVTTTLLLYLNMDIYRSFDLKTSLISFFFTMAVSVTFHEIGHATSASFFGAKTGGIGGGFYLFSPVYYTDVTDIWRLKKWQRIVVNVSGVYFEVIFCAILSLLAFLVESNMLLMIAIAVFIQSFFNLIPFLRSDGYWILSDLTNRPNLIYHTFSKLRDVLRLFAGKSLKWSWIDFLLFCYGLISLTLMSLFLFHVLLQNPNSLILFPYKLFEFFKNIFVSQSKISLVKYGELIMPLVLFTLVFGLLKSGLKKVLRILKF